ncbi:DUF5989 family protein [Anthocerotibacter panamensis]|uniref:DUF5989 family protein n=1 Tax=Anthocerotibacter panamensis TaxID=2857077 RepID=UPI001C403E61|nr:DUF5989 family protein [Anthocerotibacter panamensis]
MNKFARTRRNVSQRGGTLAELFKLLWQRKLWWLIPLVVLLVFVVALLIFANAAGVVAPFLYTVF